ncbi:MAG: spore germination protein [Peptococcaceae bacterium]|nr:spore germination protein [Peptococcaceae bacterium]
MPIVLGTVKINGIQSAGAFNVAEVGRVSNSSTMNMQGGPGSFNVGDFNLINNPLAVSNSLINDPDPSFSFSSRILESHIFE